MSLLSSSIKRDHPAGKRGRPKRYNQRYLFTVVSEYKTFEDFKHICESRKWSVSEGIDRLMKNYIDQYHELWGNTNQKQEESAKGSLQDANSPNSSDYIEE